MIWFCLGKNQSKNELYVFYTIVIFNFEFRFHAIFSEGDNSDFQIFMEQQFDLMDHMIFSHFNQEVSKGHASNLNEFLSPLSDHEMGEYIRQLLLFSLLAKIDEKIRPKLITKFGITLFDFQNLSKEEMSETAIISKLYDGPFPPYF